MGAIKIGYLTAADPWLGGEYYRAVRPAALANHHLGFHAAVSQQAGVEEGDDAWKLVLQDGRRFRPDIIIVRPIKELTPGFIEQAHAAGQPVILDLDDDIWSHEDRPEMGGSGLLTTADTDYEAAFPLGDAVIVSTPALVSVCRQHTKAPIFVLPNCYDAYGPRHYGPTPKPGTRRIGTRMWVWGRRSVDLDLYDRVILPLLEELDLVFVHVGATKKSNLLLRGWPVRRVESHPSMPAPLMGEVLGTVSVGVICLGAHPFNVAKTVTHAVELAAIGLPLLIVDPTGHYEGVPGVVTPPMTAADQMAQLLGDPMYWHAQQQAAQEWSDDIAFRSERDHLAGLQEVVAALS